MGESCKQCKHLQTESESLIAQVFADVTEKTNKIEELVLENKQLKQTVQELNIALSSVITNKMNISVALDNTKDEYSNILAKAMVDMTEQTCKIGTLVLENEQIKQTIQELNLRLNSVMADKMNISVALENTKDENSNILAQVLGEMTAKTCKIEKLVSENEQIKQTVQELNLRLNSVMADKMNKSGALENTNDEFSNTHLAQRFDSTVKQIWIDVNDEIEKEFKEMDRLSILSQMCQTVFTAFHTEVEGANQRILDSIFSDENTFTDSILTEVRTARKLNSGKCTTREKQVKKILDTIKWPEDVKRIISTRPGTRIKTFMTELAEVCWLMVTSNPPLILNFSVKGKEYTTCIRDKFVEFGTSEAISHSTCEPGHVLLVAWPSVELENNKGYLTKGEVVVMPKNTNTE